MIQLRQQSPALMGVDFKLLHPEAEDYIAFLRQSLPDRQSCLVILNFSNRRLSLIFDLKASSLHCLFSTHIKTGTINQPDAVDIAPFGFYIGEL
jgi:hypothetical protein